MIQDDLVKGHQLVIPYAIQKAVTAMAHASHIGIEGCIRSNASNHIHFSVLVLKIDCKYVLYSVVLIYIIKNTVANTLSDGVILKLR